MEDAVRHVLVLATLWHMIDRLAGAERSLVIARRAKLVPPPKSVTLGKRGWRSLWRAVRPLEKR